MCTKTELNIIVQKVADAYKTVYGEHLLKIVLYGSYARGDYDSESDIDLVALVDGDRETLQELLKKVWDVSSDLEVQYGTIVSPTVIPNQEFLQYQDDLPYYRNIIKEGVEIVA